MRKEGRGGANPECGEADEKRAPCENDRGRGSQLEAVVRVVLVRCGKGMARIAPI